MPKREQTFRCFCESCRAGPRGLDGKPLGVVFPVSQRVSHLAHVKAEREALLAPSPTIPPLSVDLNASVFAHAIIDNLLTVRPIVCGHLGVTTNLYPPVLPT